MRLENEFLRVNFKLAGSEWTSLYDKKRQIEYAYQADASWSGRNPTLFPVVGKLKNESYLYQGKTYHLGNHGFARYADFTLVSQTQQSLSLRLTDNNQTRANYPFAFRLTNTYQLNEASLEVTTQVFNPGKSDLLFSVGAHPAFRCPLLPGEKFSDYRLIFAQEEELQRLKMNPADSSFIPERQADGRRKTLPLNYDLFAEDALVWENLRSRYISLQGPHCGLKFSFSHVPWFGVWTKPGDPFLCLEPWHGHGDFANYQGDFSQREGTIVLPPAVTFEFAYQIQIL